MKTPTKIILGLAIALAGLSCYVWYIKSHAPKQRPNPIGEVAKKNIQTEAKEIAKEVDKNGLTHTIYKMVKEIDQSAVDAVSADLLDTIAALNITRDKLRQVTVVNTTLAIQRQALERKVSELATIYSHKDGHFALSVNVPNDSSKTATFDAGYDADLITTQYDKPGFPFFGSNSTYMDIYSNDPRFTIKGARSLTVKQRGAAAGFELRAGASFNKFNGFTVGPLLRLKLGRLDIDGNYNYFANQRRWNWGVGGSYRIGGF